MYMRACLILLVIYTLIPYAFPDERPNYKKNSKFSRTIIKHGQRQSSSCKCGLSNSERIIGGNEIDIPRKYPWLVYIQIRTTGLFYNQCTGSLISSGHVLTAAHCAHNGEKYWPNKGVSVYIGDHNVVDNDDDLSEETLVLGGKIIKHPKYDYKTSNYDIILLKLEKQLDLNEFKLVRPICLPPSAKSKYFRINAVCAGWGALDASDLETPDTPYELTMKTTNKKCHGYPITKNQICTDILWEEETPFFGDSGGPLMFEEEDGRYTQIGILSGGMTRSEEQGSKAVGVWTSTAKLLKWITKKIKSDIICS